MREPHRAVLVPESALEDVERLLADLDTPEHQGSVNRVESPDGGGSEP